MTLKLYGNPNSLVVATTKQPITGTMVRKNLFRFDANGEYLFTTKDAKLMERLKRKLRYEEIEIENNADETPSETIQEEPTLRHCKKCSFATTNQGILMKHYREEHKEDK